MTARVLYVQAGSDPATIVWPQNGPLRDKFMFTSGTPLVVDALIGYGDGTITYADGRAFPMVSVQGSTFKHQK